MKRKTGEKKVFNKARSAKECAYIAVFVSLLIGAQLALSFLPGIEVVTALFVSYAFVMGIRRGMIVGVAFALLRQWIFGFFPNVLILYLVYYNLLALTFGFLGKRIKERGRGLFFVIVTACVCTVCFTLLDDVITPLYYGYTLRLAKLYFYASLSVVIPQTVCVAISVGILFLPLRRAFSLFLSRLEG